MCVLFDISYWGDSNSIFINVCLLYVLVVDNKKLVFNRFIQSIIDSNIDIDVD